MAWIESHQSMARHPKLIRLARLLRTHKAQAIGHLQLLWWWTLDYAPSGDVSVFTSCELSAAAEWTGDPVLFEKSLIECGWIDGEDASKRIHDWHFYAGKYLDKKAADRIRKSSKGIPAEFQRKSQVPTSNTNKPIQQDHPPPPDPPPEDPASFAKAWIQANHPNLGRQWKAFADLISAIGKPEAIRRSVEAIAAGKLPNPFAYAGAIVSNEQARNEIGKRNAVAPFAPVTGWKEGVLANPPPLTLPPPREKREVKDAG